MKYPKALEALIDQFSSLPSVGRKTAERFAFYVYSKMPKERIELFSDSLVNLHQQLHSCSCCGNISEEDLCSICKDPERNHKQVLVVEQIKDLFTIENVNEYRGIYHVLGGAISFSKGIGIDDLNLSSLIRKVKNKEVDELILATNATLEGETTARYIKELLQDEPVKITRIAHGLPVGGDLSYADEMTVLKAFEGRREY
ncbi:MAG TPA: recombination protein RecR [Candidatus Pelethenecus faecipullorum]|uniref:Recombination protein RecR n=1 Tax=Candidatus Pelethenecus faecipullorum TaxID=2840900 RepID=A0A9D1GST9_9MOLU|nr:recombination protein RecR [Candidatus Pelethenecus faecipullorum]